ncbi:MAG: BMP family lipoprotein [Oscillospiraceae bacterium]
MTEGDLKSDTVPFNIALICYQEEQAGYLAGYAAVQEGYKELGFLGGIDVPAVVRYGYGFIMGADKAAQELNLTDVNIKYWYSGSFQPNDDIATKMDNWYVGGTEVVFACGGGIYLSCQSAAEANDGKMIGVDVDQSNVSDRIITSAMKALSNSVVKALTDASANGWTWPQNYAGVCQYLGAADNCVGLPSGDLSVHHLHPGAVRRPVQCHGRRLPGCGQQQQPRCEACHHQRDRGLPVISPAYLNMPPSGRHVLLWAPWNFLDSRLTIAQDFV